MHTGIHDLLCVPAREPSVAHHARGSPHPVPPPPSLLLPWCWCPWKHWRAPTEPAGPWAKCFMETSGPNPAPGPTLGVFFTSLRWSLVTAFWFSSALQGSGFPWGVTPPWHPPRGGRGLRGSQGCASWGSAAAQPPLPPSPPCLASPHLADLNGRNPPPKMFAVTVAFMNIWNVLPGWKATYLVSFIA